MTYIIQEFMAFTAMYIKFDINLFQKSYYIYNDIYYPRLQYNDITKRHVKLKSLHEDM